MDKGKPEPGKIYSLTGGHGTPSIASGNTWAESEVKRFKIKVDLDASREEAEHLESLEIVAQDEDEALEKADEIVKKNMYGGPYYNVSEIENE
jgi:hypothetical protein|tara:strand:+ start:2502 stop:2780 length:279 start_codon:yes stop_codon:yes gene_type:complete